MKHKEMQRAPERSKRPPARSKEVNTVQSDQDAGDLLQRAEEAPETLTPEDVMQIQRIHGNRYASRRLEGKPVIQAKLTVGPANDAYEQEADQAAASAMIHLQRQKDESIQRQPEEEDDLLQGMFLQREAVEEEDLLQGKFLQRDMDEEEELQAKLDDDALGGTSVGADIESQINSAKGGGKPLGDGIRSSMEGAFGTDFGGVRVHDNAQSDSLNRSVQAKAFTTGSDIFFSKGTYNPGSSSGQKLLAHELTHTIQQGAVAQRSEDVQREDGGSIQRLAAVADFKNATNAGKLVKRKRIKQLDWALEQYHEENAKPQKSYALLNGFMQNIKDAAQQYLVATESDKKNKRRTGVQELLAQIAVEQPILASLEKYAFTIFEYEKLDYLLEAYEWHNKVSEDVHFVRPNAAFELDKLMMQQIGNMHASEDFASVMASMYKERLHNLQNNPATSQMMKHYLINTVNPILFPEDQVDGEQDQEDFDPEKALTDYQERMSEENKLKKNKIGSTGKVSGTYDTGKVAAFGGFLGVFIQKIKEFFSENLDASDGEGFRDSIKTFGSSFLGWATKGLSLVSGFGLILKGIYSIVERYKQYRAFKGTSENLQGQIDEEQRFGVDESQSKHKSVKEIAAYAAAKVKRALISTVFRLVMNIGKFVSQIAALFTGGIAEIAAMVFQALKYLETAVRKIKGFVKMVAGKRGKHRAENASKLVDEALTGNKEALQLLVDLAPFGLMWKAKLRAKKLIKGRLELLRHDYPNSLETMYTYLRTAESGGVLAEVKDHLFGVMASQ